MNKKIVLYTAIAAGLAAVAAGGYVLGRYQAGSLHVETVAASDANGNGTPGAPAPNHGAATSLPAGTKAPQAFVQFQVGSSNVKAVLVDGPVAWLGTSSGLIKYDSRTERHTRYDNRSGLLSNGVFYLGKFGEDLWVGTYGGGLSILDTESERWRNYNIPNGMGDAFVYDVLKTQSGDVWIATWSGANRVIGGDLDDIEKWELYTVENTGGGLPNDWVYGLAEGTSGEIWMATEGGLARFENGKWDNWNHASGLGAPYDVVADAIQYDNDPGQYSAHHARQKKEQGLKDVAVAYNPNYIISLVVDADGSVWAGTWGAGLSHFDGAKWHTFTTRDGLPGNHIFALDRDESGTIWIGTSSGLARYDGGGFTTFGSADGLFSETVFAIDASANGSSWIGGFGGVTWFPRGIRKHTAG